MSVARRLIGSFGATILGPAITILVQLINVPIMLRFWGPELYGEWLIISAIPTYLVMTDMGFGNVAGTDMTMRIHAGDRGGAIETFQSIAIFVLGISLVMGAAVSAAIFLLPVHRLLHLSAMSSKQTKLALFILCINCLIVLQWSVLGSAYRCAGLYARVMLYVNLIRILEGVSFLVLLVSRAGPVQLSMLMLGISVAGTTWLVVAQRRLIPWLPFGLRHARRRRVHELWRPAVAYMAFPTGSALSLQGMTIMLGLMLGPLSVAVFNPMRTLSRTVFQLTDAVKTSVWQELSAAYGKGNWELSRRLHRAACQISLWLAFFASVALALLGPRIFAIWTHGRIAMDLPTFYILLAVVLVNSGWNASSAVPMAANRHQRVAVAYLGCTTISLAIGYVLIRYFALRGAATALLFCDLGMSIYVVRVSIRLVFDNWPAFAASMLDLAQLKVLRAKLMQVW